VKLLPGESIDFSVHGTAPAENKICDVVIEYIRYAEKAPLFESRVLTHSYIRDNTLLPAVLKSDANTGEMMDNAPRSVTKVMTTDFVLAKIIFIFERMSALLTELFR
jgi:hypothetical protein